MNLTIKIERSLGIQHLGNPLGQNYTDYHMFFSKQYKKKNEEDKICFMKFFTVW